MRALLASMACEPRDLESNLAQHRDVLGEARRAGCDLAVFPEFSLTGSVDPGRNPERAIGLDDGAVQEMVEAACDATVGALFGLAEQGDGGFFITQAYALDGQVAGVQRKRHLGEGEEGFAVATDTASFECGAARFGSIIGAESGVDAIWDRCAATGASVLFVCSAQGLRRRRIDEASRREGFEWGQGGGLGEARRQAARLGLWVAMATHAGSNLDEDFPGIAALIAPTGEVAHRLADWQPGTLIVDIPVVTEVEPVRWSIRVLVVNEQGQTLLVQFGDDITGQRWWVPPGGGIEPGEDDGACARRELHEELGRDDLVVGRGIGQRGGTFPINGRWLTQYERWYLCRCSHFEVAQEVVARVRDEGIRELRWWSSQEMRAAGVHTGPRDLPDLLDGILAGRTPDPQADLGR